MCYGALFCSGPVCRNPFDPNERVVKRLIGVDGDWVRPRGNKHDVLRVPEGCCWVEGDNPGISGDSNQFGPVRYLNNHHTFTTRTASYLLSVFL